MRFRHCRRYYFELDCDGRKVDLLVEMLREAVSLLTEDLRRFSKGSASVLAEE